MLRKILFAIVIGFMLFMFSACSYFMPAEVHHNVPELRKSEKIVMPSLKIRTGNLYMMFDINGVFIPEPTKLFAAEAEITGVIQKIYFSQGEEVKKDELVIEFDTETITDKILVQEISVAKLRLSYEENLILFETGRIDKYSMKLSSLTLEAAENYLSDLKEELGYHYIYAPADGVVVNLKYDVGDRVSGDLFEVSLIRDGIFEVLIPIRNEDYKENEVEIIKMQIGDKALIIYEGIEYEAELVRDLSEYYINFGFDPGYNHIHFKCKKIPKTIAFNKSVTVRNITAQAEGAVVIPMNAVYSAESNPYTYVIIGDEIEKRQIEIGMNDSVFYEVISGLKEGESVLKIN